LRTLPPGTDYTFLVKLTDSRGHLWLETDGNGYDPGDWQPEILGLQLLTFHLPGDIPPLTYDLIALVVNRQSGLPLPTADGTASVPLGKVEVKLADKPRAVDVERLPNADAVADLPQQQLWLRGYNLNYRQLSISDELPVTLHWQVQSQPPEAYLVQFWLRGENGEYRWPTMSPLGGEWPTDHWPAGYHVQDKLTLPILPEIAPGTYRLVGNWLTPSGDSLTSSDIDLGLLTIQP
jgi:hypothetical protein